MLTKSTSRREQLRETLRQSRRRRTDSGQAMLIVVSMMAVLVTVPIVVMSTAVSQIPLTTQNLNWDGAYEAAQAGLNDYTEQLDAAANFAQWISTNKAFSCPSNPAGDPAFCGWQRVGSPAQNFNPPEWFEYAPPALANGALQLSVSGKAGTGAQAVVRTFRYSVVPESSFLDNIYWSNYETLDPTLSSSCAGALGVPNNTPMSNYGGYAAYYASSGPPAVWTTTATVNRNSTSITVISTAGLSAGEGISDTGNSVPNGTTIAGLSGTVITLSNSTGGTATVGDTLNVATGTVAPYSASPWPPASGGCWIVFATGDDVAGPLFSNDTLRISGTPNFYTSVYSSAAYRNDPPTIDGGTGNAEPPCVNSSSPYNLCAHPPLSRGNEPDPTTGADVAPAQEVGCYITGGTAGGATSAPAQVTMSLAAAGPTTTVTWSGSGYTFVNNQATNTNNCGASGAAGSNGGTVTVSNLAAGLFFVNGNVTITAGSTDDGFLTIVAGNQSSAGPVEWSTITGNTSNNSSSVTGLSATSLIAVGDTVNDAGNVVPGNATVQSIAGSTITMSQQATGTLSGDLLTFTSPTILGNLTAGSKSVSNLPTGANVAVGDLIADNDGTIPPLTTVTGYSSASKTLTLSQPANTTDGTDQLNLSSQNANTSAGDIAIDGSLTYSGPVVGNPVPSTCPSNWSACPQSDQSDALGLVAQNFVELPEAIGTGSSCSHGYTIEAAILALSDSVYVAPAFTKGWTQGNWQCYLNVFGSIAQNYRGAVGTVSSTGYIKQYVYDNSLLALWPPYYLSSQSATWGPVTYEECKDGPIAAALAAPSC